MKKKIAFGFIFLLLCISIILLLMFVNDIKYNDTIASGVFICDLYVGELPRKEAKIKLQKWIVENTSKPITLTYNQKRWNFVIGDYLEFDVEKSIENAFTLIKSDNFLKKYILRQRLKKSTVCLEPVVNYKKDNLRRIFDKLNKTVKIEPINACFNIEGDAISILKDVTGVVLDEEKLKKDILKKIWSKDRLINVPVMAWEAYNTARDLEAMEIKYKIGEFSTKFNKALKGRTENIKLAANQLNRKVIPPGEVFSFNEIVGERTREKGYKEALIFRNNETVSDIGGGICQVSSSIYNLALLTNLEIIERVNHSLPVSYVPLGQDATVNYDTIDLKFKNNTGGFLLLAADVIEDTITVKFFGSKIYDKSVKIVSETVKTISPPVSIKKDYALEKGKITIKQGSPGYQVKVWKIYIDGKEEQRVLISTDIYNPTSTILYVGEKANEHQEFEDNKLD